MYSPLHATLELLNHVNGYQIKNILFIKIKHFPYCHIKNKHPEAMPAGFLPPLIHSVLEPRLPQQSKDSGSPASRGY